jgi:dGTPase
MDMLYTRQILEDLEEKFLTPYATFSKNSKGRLYSEDEADYRNCFQRDRDRIIHTTAFRRLEYKTQVFINFEGDYYRTRLTHTLEVTQIGRTIARSMGVNEDLVEAICLAHDMGHPPFGHSGESILNDLMKDHEGFDHNKQSLRIVTELEQRYPNFPGLNLTWETLEGIVKHETEYDKQDANRFSPELRGNLEAQITNIADELAYTAHDLDDGLRSGIITPSMLDPIEIWQHLTQIVGWQPNTPFMDVTRHSLIRKLIGLEVNDFIQNTAQRIGESRVKSSLELQQLPENIASFTDGMIKQNRQLKNFLFQNLYRNYRVMRMTKKAEDILTRLFTAYRLQPSILPGHVQQNIPKRGLERTICDYIAGMTDRFAIEEHLKLFDPSVLP